MNKQYYFANSFGTMLRGEGQQLVLDQIEEIKRSGDPFVCWKCGAPLEFTVMMEGPYVVCADYPSDHNGKWDIDMDYRDSFSVPNL